MMPLNIFAQTVSIQSFTIPNYGICNNTANATLVLTISNAPSTSLPVEIVFSNLSYNYSTGYNGATINNNVLNFNWPSNQLEPIQIPISIGIGCNVLGVFNNLGIYVGYTGTYPYQTSLGATVSGQANSFVSPIDIQFPNLYLENVCNYVWDPLLNQYVRTIRIKNNGQPIDLTQPWEIKIIEDVNGLIPTLTSDGLPAGCNCTFANGNQQIITLSSAIPNINTDLINMSTGLTDNVFGNNQTDEILIIQKTNDCLNFNSTIYVGFNCAPTSINGTDFCVGSQPSYCNVTHSAVPNLFINNFMEMVCDNQNNLASEYTLFIGNNGNVPAVINEFVFTKPITDFVEDYEDFTFTVGNNTSNPVFNSIVGYQNPILPLSVNDVLSYTFNPPLTLNVNQICTLQFKGDVNLPDLECNFRIFDQSAFYATYLNGCGNIGNDNKFAQDIMGSQPNSGLSCAPAAQNYNLQMGDLAISPPTGPLVLAGVSSGIQPTYDIVFPIQDCGSILPKIDGVNPAFLVELTHCQLINSSPSLDDVFVQIGNSPNWYPLSLFGINQLNESIQFSQCSITPGNNNHSICLIPFGNYSFQFNGNTVNVVVNKAFISNLKVKYELQPICGNAGPCNVELKVHYVAYSNCAEQISLECGSMEVVNSIVMGCSEGTRIVVCPGCVTAGILNGIELGIERVNTIQGNVGLKDNQSLVSSTPPAGGDGFYDMPAVGASNTTGARTDFFMYGDVVKMSYFGEVQLNYNESHDGGNYHPYISNPNFGNLLHSVNSPAIVSDDYQKGFIHAYVTIKIPSQNSIDIFNAFTPAHVLNGNSHFAEFTITSGGNTFVIPFDAASPNFYTYNGITELKFDISLPKWQFNNGIGSASTSNTQFPFVYNNNTTIEGEIFFRISKNIELSTDFGTERFFLIQGNGYLGLREEPQGSGSESGWLIRQVELPVIPHDFLSIGPYFVPNSNFNPNLPVDPITNPETIQVGVMNDHLCEYFSGFTNPLYPGLQNPIQFAQQGIVHVLNSCDDLAWECQTSLGSMFIGGFNYLFPLFNNSTSTVNTCGITLTSPTPSDFGPINGEQLFIMKHLLSLPNHNFHNAFPDEYRHWAERDRIDVEFIGSGNCNISPVRIFSMDDLVKTTAIHSNLNNNGIFFPNVNLSINDDDCENGSLSTNPNIIANPTNIRIDQDNLLTASYDELPACDDAFSWSHRQHYIALPCGTSCVNGEFCIRQEVNLHPEVNTNNGLINTTHNIADGLDPANRLPAPTAPIPRNGSLLVNPNNPNDPPTKRYFQQTISDITTVSPILTFSNPTFDNPSFGANGLIEWEIQVENRSLVADAPNPWLSIHIPDYNGLPFWSNLEVELIPPLVPPLNYPNLTQCPSTMGAITNGIGGYPNVFNTNIVNTQLSPFINLLLSNGNNNQPITLNTSPINSSSNDFLVTIPNVIHNGNTYYNVLRKSYRHGNGNCNSLNRSHARFKIKLHYDCDMVTQIIDELSGNATSVANFLSSLRPKVWMGYACDDDLNYTNVPLFNNQNVLDAQDLANQSCGSISSETNGCLAAADCQLNFNFLQEVVAITATPPSGSYLDPCSQELSFTIQNLGQPNQQHVNQVQLYVDPNTMPSLLSLLPTNVNDVVFTLNGQQGAITIDPSYVTSINANGVPWGWNIDLEGAGYTLEPPSANSNHTLTITYPFPIQCNIPQNSQLVFYVGYSGCFVESEPFSVTYNLLSNGLSITGPNQVCSSNANISLSALGGCSPYQWSATGPAAVNFSNPTASVTDLQFSTPGNYQISLTSNSGCTATQTVTYSDLSGVNAVIPTLACTNSTTNFSFSPIGGIPPFQYQWNNGGWQNSNQFTGLSSGTHQLAIKDATGCIVVETISVVSDNQFEAEIVLSTNECTTPLLQVVIEPSQNVSYEWSNGSSLDFVYPCAPYGSSSTYAVTATSQQSGCTASATINYSLPPGVQGCYGQTVYLSELTGPGPYPMGFTSWPAAPFQNPQLTIQGTVIIDHDYDIDNPKILMGEGAQFVVLDGITFNVDGSGNWTTDYIKEAGNCQWKGIKAEIGSSVKIRSFALEGAQYALELNHKTSAIVWAIRFNRNFIGVYIPRNPNGNNVNWNSSNGDNLFTCLGDIPHSYTGQINGNLEPNVPTMDQFKWGWAGIFANHTTFLHTATVKPINRNIFEQMANGIVLNASNAYVQNTIFRDIPSSAKLNAYLNHTALPNISNGNGIYARGLNNKILVEGMGAQPFSEAMFTKCRKAVLIENGYGVTIRNLRASQVLNGLLVRGCVNRNISITKCYLDIKTGGVNYPPIANQNFAQPYFVGVQSAFNGFQTSFVGGSFASPNDHLFTGLDIFVFQDQTVNSTVQNRGVGISVQNTIGTNCANMQILNNNIWMNRGVDGIRITGVSHGTGTQTISQNRIYTNGNSSQNGILLSASRGVQVMSNTVSPSPNISFNSANVSPFYPRGFTIQQSYVPGSFQQYATPNNIFECNKAYNLRTGYRFEGTCANTIFRMNDIGDIDPSSPTGEAGNYIGLHVTNNSIIGQQFDRSNRWFNIDGYSGNNNNFTAWNANVNAQGGVSILNVIQSQFRVNNSYSFNPYMTGNLQLSINRIWPQSNAWVLNTGPSINFNCSVSPPAFIANFNDDSIISQVIRDEFINSVYDENMDWMAERAVYNYLRSKDSLTQEELDFVMAFEQSSLDSFRNVDITKTVLSAAEISLQFSMDSLQLILDSLNTEVIILDSLLADSLTSTPVLGVIQKDCMYKIWELQSALENLDSLFKLASTNRNTNGRLDNNSITTPEMFQYYKKTVNDIYLETIAEGQLYFSEQQYNTLHSIATRCFLESGEAVFDARAMLSLVDEVSYNDYDLCADVGYYMKKDNDEETKEGVTYNLYPNPTNEFVTIFKKGSGFEGEVVTITDLLGSVIKKQTLTKQIYSEKIDLLNLSSGCYYVEVKQGSNVKYKTKLVVVK